MQYVQADFYFIQRWWQVNLDSVCIILNSHQRCVNEHFSPQPCQKSILPIFCSFAKIIDEKWYFDLVLNLCSFYFDVFIECFNSKDYISLFLEVLFCSFSNLLGCLCLLFLLIISNPIFIPSNVLYIAILNLVSQHFSISNHLVLNFCCFANPQSQPPVSLCLC